MNRNVQDDLQRRITALERTAVRFRIGEITDTGPLAVALGGSDVPYTDVRSTDGSVTTGDIVACLVFGNDLIILGLLNDV